MVLFALPFLLRLAAAGDINASVDAQSANISQIKQTLLVDYTNTIVYSLTETELTTVGLTAPYGDVEGVARSMQTYTVRSVIAAFVPTVFRVKKLVDVTPAPSKWAGVPPPTQSLRFVIFQPYVLCIGTFAILFLGGAFWTYRCRKEIQVLQPEALAQDNDELDDMPKKKKSGSVSRGRGRGRGKGRARGRKA